VSDNEYKGSGCLGAAWLLFTIAGIAAAIYILVHGGKV